MRYVHKPPCTERRADVFLSFQASFASKDRGKAANAQNALALAMTLHSPDFQAEYLDRFKSMSKLEREEVVLYVLSERARFDETQATSRFRYQRKLVPEITMDLCADDGEGFGELCSNLSKHVLEPDLVASPIPHADFFRKFEISKSGQLIPGAADRRAWLEDVVLVRTSLLINLCGDILARIVRCSNILLLTSTPWRVERRLGS
jgi:hypothetical protein